MAVDLAKLVPQPHGGAILRGGNGGAGGRPCDYRPECCEIVLDQGARGATIARMTLACGQSKPQTLHDWAARYPEFLEAFTRARLLSQDWWEQQGQNHLVAVDKGPKINDRLWSRMVGTMFEDWRERKELTIRQTSATLDLGRMTPEQLARVAAGEHPLAVLASVPALPPVVDPLPPDSEPSESV